MQTAPTEVPGDQAFTPQWVHDAVFYQIFPDRFARSLSLSKPANLESWESPPTAHGFKGGDLVGIVEHLDYLQDLGASALYLNPVFQSTANHRYHTHDYYRVDPLLGGDDALRLLLDEAHRRDMRIVLDAVLNHASRGFYQFSHVLENGLQSPYVDWFHILSWPLDPYPSEGESPGYASWWNLPALPKFNTSAPEVREFLWRVGQYWIERGIDGWRLDVPNEIDDDAFWQEFRRRVKGANPDAYIVGEIWGDAHRWLQGDQFDGVMNYIFTRACLGFLSAGEIDISVVDGTGLAPVPVLDAPGFEAVVHELLGRYPWPATLAQLNMLDSHDTARFLTIAHGDEASLRLATLCQMAFPGAPCIYYGDEIGMSGGPDPDSRRSFPWSASLWNESLRSYMKRCIELRRRHRVLRVGAYTSLHADGGVYVFARTLGQDLAIVALNAGHDARALDLELPFEGVVAELASAFDGPIPTIVDRAVRGWYLPSRAGTMLLGKINAEHMTSQGM
jgi:neopullulanase